MASGAARSRNDPRTTGGAGGFTLVELLTVVAILSILAILAGPSFGELVAQQRVQVAASDLFTSLLRARSEAIKQNTEVTLAPSATWNAGWAISVGGTNIDAHGAIPNILISESSSLPAITYRNSGRVSGTTTPKFTFSSTQTAVKRCVAVSLSGEPVVTRSACS